MVVVVLKMAGRRATTTMRNTEREKSAFETVAEHEGAVEVGLYYHMDSNFFNRHHHPSFILKRSFSPFFLSRKGSG